MLLLVLYGSAFILIAGTATSLFTHDHWIVRVFDFPRKQMAVGILCAMIGLAVFGPRTGLSIATFIGLSVCLVYQFDHIIQYTRLAPKEVRESVPQREDTETISVLSANVEVCNRNAGAFLEVVEEENPDIILAIETDDWWCTALSELEQDYKHTVLHPQENAYGMCLYSKYPLQSRKIRHLISDDIPSIKAEIVLDCGVVVTFWGMHPRPPHPVHEPDTTRRDAELIVLGREIRAEEGPTIVAGDLNDVSWSHTTDLFQYISGMLDPRRGRGFYNTFHARYPIIRYPLDHVFHSEHFRHERLEILRYIGSDHDPVVADLQYDPQAPAEHDPPEKCHIVDGWADHEMQKLERKR